MRLGAFGVALGMLVVVSLSCSNKNNTIGTLPPGTGLCESTCAKTCGSDSDCETSQGELCCDYGAAGKACSQASACPIMCTDDSTATRPKARPASASIFRWPTSTARRRRTASSSARSTPTARPAMFAAATTTSRSASPPRTVRRPAATSTDCNTANGEICCTSIPMVEPHINATGLCLNPAYAACPKTCTQSTDCNTAGNEICCDGVCSTTCAKTCKSSSDCNQQICCKSALVNLPPPTQDLLDRPALRGHARATALRHLRFALRLQRNGDGILPGLHAPDGCRRDSAMAHALSPAPPAGRFTAAARPTARAARLGRRPEPVSRRIRSPAVPLAIRTTAAAARPTARAARPARRRRGPASGPGRITCSYFSSLSYRRIADRRLHLERHDQRLQRDDRAVQPRSRTRPSCGQQFDCSGWSTGTTTCTGTLTPCASLTSSTTCGADVNCYWSCGTTTLHGDPYAVRVHHRSDDLHIAVRLLWVDGAGDDLHRNADRLRPAEPHHLRVPAGLRVGH